MAGLTIPHRTIPEESLPCLAWPGLTQCGLRLEDSFRWAQNFEAGGSRKQGVITQVFDWLQFDAVARFHDASEGLFYLVPLLGGNTFYLVPDLNLT